MQHILGIDIGGSGIKGAPVDVERGELATERHRIPTPQPATPEAVIETVGKIVQHFDYHGPIGCGFPAVIKHGLVHTAANVDDSWIGFNLQAGLEALTACQVRVLNDADAAGIAEMTFGAGRNRDGMVVMVTLGTGIGIAIFNDGQLVPNLELGHIEIDGEDAELRASDAAREREDLSWKKWGKRVDRYLNTLENLIWPDLYIIGGGVSKKWTEKVEEYIKKTQVEIVPAEMRNEAGIIGAALAAAFDYTDYADHVAEIMASLINTDSD